MSSTVVLTKQRTTSLPTTKLNPAKQYLETLWTKTLGYLSFVIVISFLFIPVCFTAFLFAYFGILPGVIFVASVGTYNYFESKYHPLGETKRKWNAFNDLIGMIIIPRHIK